MSFNKVIMVGNLTKEIELRYTQGGSAIANTSIATNRKFKDSNGVQKEEVCFIDVTFFGRLGEIANQYLKKGSKVLVEGRLKLDNWVDNNGVKKSKHSIVVENMQMLSSNNQTNSSQTNQQPQQQRPAPVVEYQTPQGQPYQQPQPQQRPEVPNDIDINDEEIPF